MAKRRRPRRNPTPDETATSPNAKTKSVRTSRRNRSVSKKKLESMIDNKPENSSNHASGRSSKENILHDLLTENNNKSEDLKTSMSITEPSMQKRRSHRLSHIAQKDVCVDSVAVGKTAFSSPNKSPKKAKKSSPQKRNPDPNIMFSECTNKSFELPQTVIQNILQHSKSDEAFDKLLSPTHESPQWTKRPLRTYSSKKKCIDIAPKILEFQDCKNRDLIVKWLNDNRNFFDRVTLTQTQRSTQTTDLDSDCDTILDMPSVSQAYLVNTNNKPKRRKSIDCSYKTRPRSLDIQITKNLSHKGQVKGHSVAGDTPSFNDYDIEDVNTEEAHSPPVEENAKALLNLMEDEYLSCIEREMMHQGRQKEAKHHSGWDRIRDIKESINKIEKKPKQLDITLNSSGDQSKSDQDNSHNETVLKNVHKNLTEDVANLEEDNQIAVKPSEKKANNRTKQNLKKINSPADFSKRDQSTSRKDSVQIPPEAVKTLKRKKVSKQLKFVAPLPADQPRGDQIEKSIDKTKLDGVCKAPSTVKKAVQNVGSIPNLKKMNSSADSSKTDQDASNRKDIVCNPSTALKTYKTKKALAHINFTEPLPFENPRDSQDKISPGKTNLNCVSRAVCTLEKPAQNADIVTEIQKYPTYNLSQVERFFETNLNKLSVRSPSGSTMLGFNLNEKVPCDGPCNCTIAPAVLDTDEHSSTPTVITQEVVNDGHDLVQKLRSLALRDNHKGIKVLRTFYTEIEGILNEFGCNLSNKTTNVEVQTMSFDTYEKQTQTEYKAIDKNVQTSPPEVVFKQIQTEQPLALEVATQTQIDNLGSEMKRSKTDELEGKQQEECEIVVLGTNDIVEVKNNQSKLNNMRTKKIDCKIHHSTTNTTKINDDSRINVDTRMVAKSKNDLANEDEEMQYESQMADSLDFVYFDTEDVFKDDFKKDNANAEPKTTELPRISYTQKVQKTLNKQQSTQDSVEPTSARISRPPSEVATIERHNTKDSIGSVLVCSMVSKSNSSEDILRPSRKRILPSNFDEDSRAGPSNVKRPCQKFLLNDVSINFNSCTNREKPLSSQEGAVAKMSGESDDYDDYLAQILKKYESPPEEQPQPTSIPERNQTQELIDECNYLIYNATKENPAPQRNPTHQIEETNETTEKPESHDTPCSNDSIFNNEECLNKMESDINSFTRNISEMIIPETEDVVNTTPKTVRRSLFAAHTPKLKNNVNSESLFGSETNKATETNQEVTITEDNIDIILRHISKENVVGEADQELDEEVQSITSLNESKKIKILQNVVLKPRKSKECDPESNDSSLSDVDIVESTPQKFSKKSEVTKKHNSILDITLPPPLEFQDEFSPIENIENRSLLVPPDLTMIEIQDSPIAAAVVKTPPQPKPPVGPLQPLPFSSPLIASRVVHHHSTPQSQDKDTETILSLSPIPVENKQRTVLGSIELAQQAKFTPLTIIMKPSPSLPKMTPKASTKQKSILNYMRPSQENKRQQSFELSPANKSTKSSNSSFSETPPTRPCIACSRISREKIIAISTLTNKKLANYSTTFSSRVTHLIVNANEKNCLGEHTMKFVLAVASGIWVLSFKWIQECLAKNCIVPEEPYEVLDVSGVDGPRQARLTKNTRPLFKGYKVHAAPPFLSTTQADVETVVKLLGGVVASRPEDLLDKNGYICLIITESSATQDFEIFETWLEALKVATVDIEWLSRSVGQYKLLSILPFNLCSDDSVLNLDYPPELVVNVPFSFSQPTPL